jgi:lysozyme
MYVYSSDGLHLTEQFEGDRLVAYQDSKGVWTIGYGHTRGVVAGMTCTQEQADQWLAEDIAWAASEVNKLVHVPLTQAEFDSLVDFTFNCGAGSFDHSTLLKLVNAGDYAGAAAQFGDWVYAGGKKLPGLVTRRAAEATLFGIA